MHIMSFSWMKSGFKSGFLVMLSVSLSACAQSPVVKTAAPVA
jgi:hypothetical protein